MLPQAYNLNASMLPINSYVDFLPLLDNSLAKLHASICLGMLNAEINYSHAGDPVDELKSQVSGFWQENLANEFNLRQIENLRATYDKLTPAHQRKFACYYKSIYSLLTIPIINQGPRYAGHYSRHDPKTCIKHPINYALFPDLLSWIDRQNIFESYGRTIIFLTPPGFKTFIHTDRVGEQDYVEEFIWLSPARNKNIVLANHLTGEERIVQSHAMWFNSNQYHGAVETLYHSYSIRIDGKFNNRTRNFLRNKFINL